MLVFARQLDGTLTSLVKKIDEATVKNSSCDMGSGVIFLNDEEGFDKKLKEFAKKEGIKETVLAIESPGGPRGYNIPKEADVTVILYTKRNVKVNHAFKKGEFTDAQIEKVLADLKKILPAN